MAGECIKYCQYFEFLPKVEKTNRELANQINAAFKDHGLYCNEPLLERIQAAEKEHFLNTA